MSQSSSVQVLSASVPNIPGRVVYFPRPMTHDLQALAQKRVGALHRYREARTDAERMQALIWVNHWRWQYRHAIALEALKG